jgi:two-component SAPR family response regulator
VRILIVEDEILIALGMQSVLLQAGHIVTGLASTIQEALDIVALRRPDLALVNISLKGNKTAGIELAGIFQERYGIPSLFVSGDPKEARKNPDVALGYLSKPYASRTLLSSVEIARQIIHGEEHGSYPSGLELFHDSGNLIGK